MTTRTMPFTLIRPQATAALTIGALCLLLQGCSHQSRVGPQAFGTPEEAVQALTTAARQDNAEKLLAILGTDGEPIISSGDEAADRNGRQKFVAMYDQKHSLAKENDQTMSLVIGESDFPFPIPIVKEGDEWVWDAEAGKEEILNRRIGRNELATIQVCKAIGDAEHEYALSDPDNDGLHEYAQQFASDEGKRNGLFWRTAKGEPPSPMGELAVQASSEGYVRKAEGPTPYHGYYYRILKAQGPSAPEGPLDYVVDGHMILGFAILAYPADYGNSGIMTFIMGDNGVVYQKDLGEDTEKLAKDVKLFDPGEGWKKVE